MSDDGTSLTMVVPPDTTISVLHERFISRQELTGTFFFTRVASQARTAPESLVAANSAVATEAEPEAEPTPGQTRAVQITRTSGRSEPESEPESEPDHSSDGAPVEQLPVGATDAECDAAQVNSHGR
jgi:hypothetical protein